MELKIEPSYTCKLKCIHCSSTSIGRMEDMTLEQFSKIVSEAKEYGFTSLVISGGEPLLWPHLVAAIEHAAKSKMAVSLYTSGNPRMDKPILGMLGKAGVDRIIFGVLGIFKTWREVDDALAPIIKANIEAFNRDSQAAMGMIKTWEARRADRNCR